MEKQSVSNQNKDLDIGNYKPFGSGWDEPSPEDAPGPKKYESGTGSDNASKLEPFRLVLPHLEDNPDAEDFVITFIEDSNNPDDVYEHMVWIEGQAYPEFAVCLKMSGADECPLCVARNFPQHVRGLSAILGEFTDKKGRTFKNAKRTVIIGPKDQALFAKKIKKLGNLNGKTFEVTRTNKKASVIGNMWEFAGNADLDEMERQEIDLTPVPFEKKFTFVTFEQAAALVAKSTYKKTDKYDSYISVQYPVPRTFGDSSQASSSASSTGTPIGDDDDIPF